MGLPDADRAEVAARLIESLEQKFEAEVITAWGTELNKRILGLDDGSAASIPWPEARRLILDSSGGPDAG
jgi:hypothetical protein